MITTVETAARVIGQCVAAAPLTDKEVLGDLIQPCDVGKDFVSGSNCYTWWYWIAYQLCPRTIVEIGSRFGYSLQALTKGACVRPEYCKLYSFDAECDGDVTEPLKVAQAHFAAKGVELSVYRVDTRTLKTLGLVGLDLGVVDGDHRDYGAYADCGLVYDALKPGGWLLCDDVVHHPEVGEVVKRFCVEKGMDYAFLPSLRGICLARKS